MKALALDAIVNADFNILKREDCGDKGMCILRAFIGVGALIVLGMEFTTSASDKASFNIVVGISQMILRCVAGDDIKTKLLSLTLEKEYNSTSSVVLTSVNYITRIPTLEYVPKTLKAIVRGNIALSVLEVSYIELRWENVTSDDSGEYKCNVSYKTADNVTHTTTASKKTSVLDIDDVVRLDATFAGSTMTLKCRLGNAELPVYAIYLIQLDKVYNTLSKTVAAIGTGGKAVLEDEQLAQRIAATGEIQQGSPLEAFLQVVFTEIASGDSGEYKCIIQLTDNVDKYKGVNWETSKNVTVTDIDTTPSPDPTAGLDPTAGPAPDRSTGPTQGPNPESQSEGLDSGVIVLLVAVIILATFIPATWLIFKRWKRNAISKEDAVPLDDAEKENQKAEMSVLAS
ncbi:uncharacterized protein LOC121385959 [Gigantopelta aegis]|uniref:uncharacterized protein LOC121385959 n=1 Tax=Gigantopelta aegis TaxID=1735272 RepID=UPI001B88E1F4|nr:uncharacterized protein LOC121385959 [Gigantopelta aegis]